MMGMMEDFIESLRERLKGVLPDDKQPLSKDPAILEAQRRMKELKEDDKRFIETMQKKRSKKDL